MGSGSKSQSGKKKKKHREEEESSYSSSSFSSSASSDSETSSENRSSRRRSKHRERRRSSSKDSRSYTKEKSEKKHRKRKDRKHSSKRRRKHEENDQDPKILLADILDRFPDVSNDLKQLLEMIDGGQGVDISCIPDRVLVKNLKKLFLSLKLKQSDDGIYLLPPGKTPTLQVVGDTISSHLRDREQQQLPQVEALDGKEEFAVADMDSRQATDQVDVKDNSSGPRKRVMGPEMPSSELLAAAAKLTEAEAVLREAEFEIDDDLFIGPAPATVVAEAASANEAERFEEVTRIMGAEIDSPYDVLGVNHKMSADNIKKRYWKLSLMVHPDKCSHPQAHQAFVTLNKAFKALQDPDTRKAMDDKIRLKEEQEAFQAELQEMRKAAQWRRLQGISMEGDDELLAEVKMPPRREEWMTTLPPERKPGVSMQSTTSFSKTAKEGRGDTSAWTDAPADKAQKAKMSYLEAYNEAAALAANEENKRTSVDADLVDQYNRTNRSKSLVEKHQEEKISRSKRKSKEEQKKSEWEGQHPWKPWDREKDLTAGRQNVNLDPKNMGQGLTSRFSSGNIQRNFL